MILKRLNIEEKVNVRMDKKTYLFLEFHFVVDIPTSVLNVLRFDRTGEGMELMNWSGRREQQNKATVVKYV